MEIVGFECCFCKKSIKEDLTDPLDLRVTFNEDIKENTGSFQIFSAHFECLKSKLHEDVQGYLIRDDD